MEKYTTEPRLYQTKTPFVCQKEANRFKQVSAGVRDGIDSFRLRRHPAR